MSEVDIIAMTDDVASLRDSVSQVLGSLCDSAAVHAYIDGKAGLDDSLWQTAAELGWLAIALPEDLGGLGLGALGLDALYRELGRRAAPGPFISTLAAAQWLLDVAPESCQADTLPRIAAGELTIAVDAAAGSGAMLRLSDGTVTGMLDVLGSDRAGLAIAPFGAAGIVEGWAVISCPDQSVTLSHLPAWDLTRQVSRLTCAGAPAIIIPDREGHGTRALRRHLALALAADSVGAAAGITDQLVEYLKTRVQFGKPIGSFQALKHRVADIVVSTSTNGHLLDQAVEASMLADADGDMWAALAKAGATEAAAAVTGDCIQLFGGVGHTWEFDAHIYAKRARLNEALGGSAPALRDLAAEGLAAATRSGRSTMELTR